MITLTDKAIEMIKKISDEEEVGHYSVRLRTKGGGCNGFIFEMEFNNLPSAETDFQVQVGEIPLIIDQLSMQYMENVNIDYQESPLGGGFKFSSPDIKATCGCGNSYSY